MKSVSGTVYVVTLVVGIVLIGVAFMGGSKSFETKHGCTVGADGKAVCTK